MCLQMSVSLCVKRSYKKIVLGADNVVKLVIRYKLWIMTYARVLISGLYGMVFIDFLFSVPLRSLTIGSRESN